MRTALFAGLALVLGGTVAGLFIGIRSAEAPRAPTFASPSTATAPSPVQSEPASEPTTTFQEVSASPDAASAAVSLQPLPAVPPGRTNAAAAQSARSRQKPALQDPLAREALSLVGADPDAEAYWLEAIYDESLPAKEREDLMEDLNEDGLSDYKRPGPQDLPLILNRLALIEEVVPFTDDFMLTHLLEAYKDLVNLAEVTQGGGQPVR